MLFRDHYADDAVLVLAGRCRNHAGAAQLAALVCLLLVAGCTAKPTVPEADEGRAVTDRFVELVCTGKAAQAWDDTSAEFKSAEGRESFVRSMKKPWLAKPPAFETVETIDRPNGSRAEYVYRSADAQHVMRLLIAPTGSGGTAGSTGPAWCIDRLKID